MGKLFTRTVFNNGKCIVVEDYVKKKVDGLGEHHNSSLVPLAISEIAKPELKDKMLKDEYLRSYVECAKNLSVLGARHNHPILNMKFPATFILNFSYAIPCLYMCRHCIELSLKCAIEARMGKWPDGTHGLLRLWNNFKSGCPKCQYGKGDEKIMRALGSFVELFGELDDDGVNFRYAIDKNNKYTLITFLSMLRN